MKKNTKKNRNLIFIPTGDYLSDPLFGLIVSELSGFHSIYYYTKDPLFSGEIDASRKSKILNIFQEYAEITNVSLDNGRLFSFLQNVFPLFFKRKLVVQAWRHRRVAGEIVRFLDKYRPAAVIMPSDMTFSARMGMKWCKKNKVPFIIVQPSFFDANKSGHNIKYNLYRIFFEKVMRVPLMRRQKNWGCEDNDAHLILWGQYFTKLFGNKRKNIHLSGSPIYDKYFRQKDIDNIKSISRKYKMPLDKKIVVICTEGIGWYAKKENAMLNKMYQDIIEERKDLFFVIKLHPSDDINEYAHKFNYDNCAVIKDILLPELFHYANCQISVFSATSLEAVAADVPIILVNPDNLIEFIDFFQNKIELRARNVDELQKHINICLSDEYRIEFEIRRKSFLTELIGEPDGNAGKRMADTIKAIVSNNNVILFCQGPADIPYILELYECSNNKKEIRIIVMQVEPVYRYLCSLHLAVGGIDLLTSDNWQISYKQPLEWIKAKRRLGRIYKKYGSGIKNADIFYFSIYYDWLTAGLVSKMASNNQVYLIDHYNYASSDINKYARGVCDKIKSTIFTYISGAKSDLIYLNNIAVFRHDYQKSGIQLKEIVPRSSIYSKFSPKIDLPKAPLALLFESENAGGIGCINYANSLKNIIKLIKDAGFNVCLKPHPRLGYTKILDSLGMHVLPKNIPGEFLPIEHFDLIFGIESVAPAKIAFRTSKPVYSLIGLFSFHNAQTKAHFKEYFSEQSAGKLKYIDSVSDLNTILNLSRNRANAAI